MKNATSKYVSRFGVTSLLSFCALFSPTHAEEMTLNNDAFQIASNETHDINFTDVPVLEFIRFVSKISQVNFIYNAQDLQFNISLTTGKAVNPAGVVQALIQMLRVHGFGVAPQDNYYVIYQAGGADGVKESGHLPPMDKLLAANQEGLFRRSSDQRQFSVYKLKYHQGGEIQDAIKKTAADLKSQPESPMQLINAIESTQWVKATNSILFSGDEDTTAELTQLIDSLDTPLKQVFIEVLVIETDVRKSLDFGLQWAAGGAFKDKIGFGMGNFPPGDQAPFAKTFQGINATNTPTGTNQVPVGNGFDMGVIGDIIMHKGKSYLSLGSLVSALQIDGDSTIVLNQKLITQDNKNSTIFVGDNIPFTGSVVSTVGQSQQTTANIEYRDIGVSLSITPMLGDGDIITLDLDEEISETVNNVMAAPSNSAVNGIRTTKTNMVTHVHVPDKHFLVLSGMVRNAHSHQKAGLPCLGGLPVIGAAFSRTKKQDEKRNVIVFVRPHIIRTIEDFKNITETQKEIYQAQSNPADFNSGLKLLGPITPSQELH